MAVPQFTAEQLLWLAILVSGGRGNVAIAAGVAGAESSGRPDAQNVNTDAQRSVDRGLWQINSYWHSEVSDDCAYRPLCNARNAYRISNGWRDFTPWSTFNKGLYLEHMPSGLLAGVPIPASQLSTYYPPASHAPAFAPAGANPFTGQVGIAPPAPAPAQDHSSKTQHTGQRAGVHGSSVNDAANAIHRIPVGRIKF